MTDDHRKGRYLEADDGKYSRIEKIVWGAIAVTIIGTAGLVNQNHNISQRLVEKVNTAPMTHVVITGAPIPFINNYFHSALTEENLAIARYADGYNAYMKRIRDNPYNSGRYHNKNGVMDIAKAINGDTLYVPDLFKTK